MKIRLSTRLSLLLMVFLLVFHTAGTQASGQPYLRIWLDKDSYTPGDVVKVSWKIENPPARLRYYTYWNYTPAANYDGDGDGSFGILDYDSPQGERTLDGLSSNWAEASFSIDFPDGELQSTYIDIPINTRKNEPNSDGYPTSKHSQNGITVQFIYKDDKGKLKGQNVDHMTLQCGDTVHITAILTGASYSDYEEGWGFFGDDIDNPFVFNNNKLVLSSYIMPGSSKKIQTHLTIKSTQFLGKPIHISDGMDNKHIATFDKTSVRIGDTINLNLKLPYYYVAISYGYFDDLRWVTVDENGNESFTNWEGITDDFFHERNFQFVPTKGVKGAAEILFAGPGDDYIRRTDYFTIQPSQEPDAHHRGDANGDNIVDILDLVSIIDYIVSETACPSMTNADANGDGRVDILDLVWIIDRMVAA